MFPDIGRLHARRDIPIDVPNIVVRLIFPQVGQLQPCTPEQGFVISLQQAIEPTKNRPL
jgi:hypothetical protein